MIRMSARNLAIPRQMRPVYVIAAGQSDFRKKYPEKKTEELAVEAFQMLACENRLRVKGAADLRRWIHSAVYGHFADHFGDQLLGEALIHDRLGLDPLGNMGVKTGGATGGSTVWAAANLVASGYSNCVLAMGWERMDEVDTPTGNHIIAAAADRDYETEFGHSYTGYYALMAQRYAATLGGPEFRRALSQIAVKARRYAASNPFAQTSRRITEDEVEQSPILASPLRLYDAALMSVGASAVLLADEETAYALSDDPIRLFVAAGSHTLRAADRRPMEIPLLPHERANPEVLARYARIYGEGGERFPGYTGFLAARIAAYYVYGMAGVTDPLEELDLVELHDAFTISDVQTYEDIGLRPYGEGADFVLSGDAFHTNPHTGLPGKCPGNLSGGLLGAGHAIGATGIMQVAELLWQLQGQWGHFHARPEMWARFGKEFPHDHENLQVAGARRGLALSHAGLGSHVTAALLSRPEALLPGCVP